jgi:hypothetical protein
MARRRPSQELAGATVPKSPFSTSTIWYACFRAATPDRHQGRYSGPMEGARHRAEVIDASVGLHLPSLNEPR